MGDELTGDLVDLDREVLKPGCELAGGVGGHGRRDAARPGWQSQQKHRNIAVPPKAGLVSA
jgi:hypothetical protein